jgi:hypothetical protein
MKTKRILLYVAYSIGMFLAALAVTMMMLMLFDPEVEVLLKKFLVYGAAMGLGWVLVLLAALLKPFQRRYILLISLVALLSTIYTNVLLNKQDPFQQWYYWFSMIIPAIVSTFYLFVYLFSRPDSQKEDEEKDIDKEEPTPTFMDDSY